MVRGMMIAWVGICLTISSAASAAGSQTAFVDLAGAIDAAKSTAAPGGTYCLEAAVPLKLIHLDPKALGSTRGDVGRVLSDQTGTVAASRVYWANKNTNIVSDVPSEAALQPNLWGQFVFEKD